MHVGERWYRSMMQEEITEFDGRCTDCNCRYEALVRDGSFFGNGTKLEIVKIVDIMYAYLYETASIKNLARECRIASEAIIN